jgi:hypothetical protein
MPGISAASRSGSPKIAEGTSSALLTTSFIHFAEAMSSTISTVPASRMIAATGSTWPAEAA